MTISVITTLTRLPTMSPEAFSTYWKDRHGPIAAKIPGMVRYQQHHVTDHRQLGIDHARAAWSVDGFAELTFEDRTALERAMASAEFAATRADEANFIASAVMLICEKHVVVPMPAAPGPSVKRMSILARKKGMTPEQFEHEWCVIHARDVPALPRLVAYNQNLVREQRPAPATPEATIDGIVELWFPDPDAIVAAFASPAAEITQGHAKTFIETITTFLVETVEII